VTSLRATATVTGADGTVLATISRHTEPAGSPVDAPLVVVDVAGDIDADTAPLLQLALTDAISRNCHVCCDLRRVEFLSAAGINTILAALHTADDTDCTLTVRGVHGISARVFRITGLDSVLASRT
jgi:anti-anti-sigma factor